MSEVVERVARTMFESYAASAAWERGYPGNPETWDGTSDENRNVARREARVAIAAMREPTTRMCDAWWAECAMDGSPLQLGGDDKNATIKHVWAKMIDAALA